MKKTEPWDKEKFFQNLREDRAFFESFLPNNKPTVEATIGELLAAQAKIREAFPDYFPPDVQSKDCKAKINKKPIQQWSIERKQAVRLKKLISRIQAKYTIPVLYQEALQDTLVKTPWYYGVCQIDGDHCFCPDYGWILKQQKAIAWENECRANGE